jgi:hypothetical protein
MLDMSKVMNSSPVVKRILKTIEDYFIFPDRSFFLLFQIF